MPRQVRIEFDGAFYYVMCRGDRREAIYQDDQDRERFLATIGETVWRTGWRVHAYVLMSNHYDSVTPARSASGLPVYVAAPQHAPFISSWKRPCPTWCAA